MVVVGDEGRREPRPESHGEVFRDGSGLEESVDIFFGSDLHDLQRTFSIGMMITAWLSVNQSIQIMTSKLPSPMGIKAMLKGGFKRFKVKSHSMVSTPTSFNSEFNRVLSV
nr:hypothetical protein [Tanacetum cinerariifolium]